jgi:hypothetical protein
MLAKRFGVVGNPHTGFPDRVYSQRIGLGWLRALVLDDASYEAMLQQVPNTTNVAAVITGQSGPLANDFWSDGWRDRYTTYIRDFCEQFNRKVRLIEFTNEWDFWSNADRADKAAELAIIGTAICKEYGILGVLGSVASGTWKEQLAQAIARVDEAEQRLGYRAIHGFAFHPYVSYVQREEGSPTFIVPSGADGTPSEGWERLSAKIREAIRIAGGRPCAVTEVGIKVGDAGGLEEQSLYVHGVFQDELARLSPDELLMATYFCWTDMNGAPSERGRDAFGLVSEGGNLRPAYNAAIYQFQNAPTVNIPVERLLLESKPARVPDPTPPDPPQPPTNTRLTVPQAHAMRWRAIVANAPYNHEFGFERHWRKPDNAWWGSPVTENERTLEDGRPVRVFANAVVAYNADDTTEVLE